MRNNMIIFLTCLMSISCAPSHSDKQFDREKEIADIRQILADQSACWSIADLDCFMKGYWNSDSLKFIGQSGLSYGWQTTLDNYKKNYASPESMGQLKFDILEMDLLSPTSCFVIGKYHLTRTIGDLEGHFSLLWKKIDGVWVIVADHSS